jgi:type IV pilus assembly protein PilX
MVHMSLVHMCCLKRAQRRERGIALLSALSLLLAVLIVAVSAARSAASGEKAARQERDRHIALQAAEAALGDAERDIEGGADPAYARAAAIADGSGFVDGCGTDGVNRGLCTRAASAPAPAWQAADLAADDGPAVAYGSFTGAAMPVGSGVLPARLPRYIIELMPLGGSQAGRFYRITAAGFGSRATTLVVVQSFYRKAPAGTAAPGPGEGSPGTPEEQSVSETAPPQLPAGRISWREVVNWQDLHDLAADEHGTQRRRR